MRTFRNAGDAAFVSLATLFAAVFVYYLANRASIDVREFVDIRIAATRADFALQEAIRKAESQDAKNGARSEHAVVMQTLAERCFPLATKYPETSGGVAALIWAACKAPNNETRNNACQLLKARIPGCANGSFARGNKTFIRRTNQGNKEYCTQLLSTVKQNAKHPASAFLLAKVCVMCRGADEDEEPSKLFVEAAELIAKQYASSPEIENFCQCLGTFVAGSQPWAGLRVTFAGHPQSQQESLRPLHCLNGSCLGRRVGRQA